MTVTDLVKLPPEELLERIGSYPGGSYEAYALVKSERDAGRVTPRKIADFWFEEDLLRRQGGGSW